jgi:hypothetical protein
MKKLLTLAALAGMLAVQQASALTVNVNRTPGYATQPGGEFTVTSTAPDAAFNAILANFAPVAIVNGGFQTFCLSLSTELLGNPQAGTLTPSGVAAGTADLFSAFGHGTLAGYVYAPPGAGRQAAAAQLQAAIWYLQGFTQAQINASFGSSIFDASTSVYVAKAVTNLGSLANAEAANNGGFGVDALTLTHDGVVSQPLLALVSVPDGGSTVMLLGFALSGIGLISRRIRA